jgi:cobalamin transport system substrate-binding protein
MKRLLIALLPVLGVLSLACADTTQSTGRTESEPDPAGTTEAGVQIIDAAGVTHRITTTPTRIISLVPSVTETLVAIGATETILARTDFDELAELSQLPSIGAGLQPNLEAILAQGPDLVIYFYGSSDESTPRRLSESGIRAFGVRPDGVDDVRRIIKDLGTLTGRTTNAQALLAEWDRTMEEVSARIRGLPATSTVFSLGGDPPWVAGPDSYMSELITLAGGVNVFADVTGLYGPVSMEELLVRDIDVVLMGPHGEASERLGGIPVQRLPAFVEIPGPRLHLAARAIAEALHPDAFR